MSPSASLITAIQAIVIISIIIVDDIIPYIGP